MRVTPTALGRLLVLVNYLIHPCFSRNTPVMPIVPVTPLDMLLTPTLSITLLVPIKPLTCFFYTQNNIMTLLVSGATLALVT